MSTDREETDDSTPEKARSSKSRSPSPTRSWSRESAHQERSRSKTRSEGKRRSHRTNDVGWGSNDDDSLERYVAKRHRKSSPQYNYVPEQRRRHEDRTFQGMPVNADATETKMTLRKRAMSLGKFRFIVPEDGVELEVISTFRRAVNQTSVSSVNYASKPIGFRSIPRNSSTRYAILKTNFPGIGDRFHVAWSTPLGDVHVDGMVKLYDMRSIQMHCIDYDGRGPKSEWFGLVDPRVTDTPEAKVQFDANMFWTAGLLYKHYGTCGVEDWDIELADMASTHNWAETAGKLTASVSSKPVLRSLMSLPIAPAATPSTLAIVRNNNQARYTGCIVEWRGSYGFVSTNLIKGKVFLHSKVIQGFRQQNQDLPIGTSVNFELEHDTSNGFRAANARLYV